MPQNLPAGALEALDNLVCALLRFRAFLADPEPSSAARMVGLKDAARRLGLSDRTLRRRAKRFGGVKAGGEWRFDPEKLRSG